jgi:hypothetical protein
MKTPKSNRSRLGHILRLSLIVLVGYLGIGAYVAKRFTVADRLSTQDTP